MVSLTKIYTRTGDLGQTAIGDGTRVSKLDARVVAGGFIDELNSFIGVSITECEEPEIQELLRSLQQRLFDLGADVATPWAPEMTGDHSPRIGENHIKDLESLIDKFNADLESLKSFLLPGGSKAAATLHVARSVCRRTELSILSLRQVEELNPHVSVYLNRLSDLLFVLARTSNKASQSDVLWTPDLPSSNHTPPDHLPRDQSTRKEPS